MYAKLQFVKTSFFFLVAWPTESTSRVSLCLWSLQLTSRQAPFYACTAFPFTWLRSLVAVLFIIFTVTNSHVFVSELAGLLAEGKKQNKKISYVVEDIYGFFPAS